MQNFLPYNSLVGDFLRHNCLKLIWCNSLSQFITLTLHFSVSLQVKLDAMKPWIHEKLTEILGFEDDVVIDYAINQLEENNRNALRPVSETE